MSWMSSRRGPKRVPDMRAEHLRIAERRLDGEVFFERDLALHEFLPALRGIMQ